MRSELRIDAVQRIAVHDDGRLGSPWLLRLPP